MTLAYWCVFVAAILPSFWTLSYRWAGAGYSLEDNLAPRLYQETLTGWRQRAHWAHLNGLETFPVFATAVVVAHQLGGSLSLVNALSVTYVVLRIGHGIFYVTNLGAMRTLTYFGSQLCVIAIFLSLV